MGHDVAGPCLTWSGCSARSTAVGVPGSPAYDDSRPPFNARFHDRRPNAIVSCASPHDVSEAISFARRHDVQIAVRSGGHSFAGHSSTGGIVLDVTPMRSVSVSGGFATIGAGARLGEVYAALQEHGLAIPGGTCPDVGVAGLTLGGGLGILGRTYGVTADRLVAAEVVLADGRVVECDEQRDEELFWALRGAGSGNFGVVTSLVFRAVPAPDATNVHLRWPFSRAADVIAAWQSWAPNGPDALAASLKVTSTADVDEPLSVDVYGAVLGTAAAADLFDEFVARIGVDPITSSEEHMSFPETRRFWAQLGESDGPGDAQPVEPVFLFAKSEFFARPLPGDTVEALVAMFSDTRLPGEGRELDFMPWAAHTTAFVRTRRRSPTAASCSSSSTQSSSSPMRPPIRRTPRAVGSPGRGTRCIRGDPAACSRTSPTPISTVGQRRTTGRTSTG
jgi:hypothetical protein